jgi:hypothetical protein
MEELEFGQMATQGVPSDETGDYKTGFKGNRH